jgi:predicted DNA-binding protein (MmcQ/YjbR family)
VSLARAKTRRTGSKGGGIRPAPYLASRGMKWLQVHEEGAMSEASLREHIVMSYDLVVAGMTKKMRAELGV